MKLSVLILFYLATISLVYAEVQQQNWIVFTNEEIGITKATINVIIEDQDSTIWIGTGEDGLLKYDGENWTKYDTSNSTLPVNNIFSLEVDSVNNLWIGTLGFKGGLVKFDGINWTVWQLADMGMEGYIITDLEFDSLGNLWMGIYGDGLAKYDGEHFTLFNSRTTDLVSQQDQINAIKIDSEGLIWCGTDNEDVWTFDSVSGWAYYSSVELDHSIYSIDIDQENNIWFGGVWFTSQFDSISEWTKYDYTDDGSWYTDIIIDSNKTIWFASWSKGFLKLDYSNEEVWEKYTPYGFSELENEGCWAAYKDSRGNYWVGYNNGYIAVYNPDGITSTQEIESDIPSNYSLSQNYPNPFNPSTKIEYSLPAGKAGIQKTEIVSLKVYDVLGREVTRLVNKQQQAGSYEVQFNANSLTSGIYFYQLKVGSFVESRKMILLR